MVDFYVPGTQETDPKKIILSLQQVANQLMADDAAWTPFTPTVTSEAGAFTSVAATGRFSQAGQTVHFTVRIAITTNGTASSAIVVTLPAAAEATTFSFSGREQTGGVLAMVYMVDVSHAKIRKYDNTYLGADGDVIILSGTYEAA